MTTSMEVARLFAVQSCRAMRGGSQSQLMKADDDNWYVVKFQNNPQGLKILANEMLGALLARLLGVPVPPVAAIEVSEEMISLSEGMVIQLGRGRIPYQAGLCFGSLLRLDGKFWLPNMIKPETVANPADFLGMLVFDKWTGNADAREVTLVPTDDCVRPTALMVDQGFCFGGAEWNFRDFWFQGVAQFPRIYDWVTGMEDFEPWLTRLEREISLEMLYSAANMVPPEWYLHQDSALNKLIWQLNARRAQVRGFVDQTLQRASSHFPSVLVAKTKLHSVVA